MATGDRCLINIRWVYVPCEWGGFQRGFQSGTESQSESGPRDCKSIPVHTDSGSSVRRPLHTGTQPHVPCPTSCLRWLRGQPLTLLPPCTGSDGVRQGFGPGTGHVTDTTIGPVDPGPRRDRTGEELRRLRRQAPGGSEGTDHRRGAPPAQTASPWRERGDGPLPVPQGPEKWETQQRRRKVE